MSKDTFYELIIILPIRESSGNKDDLQSLLDCFKEKGIEVIKRYDFGERNLAYRVRDRINQRWVNKAIYQVFILKKENEFDFNLQLLLKWHYRTGDFKPLRFEVTTLKDNKVDYWMKGLDSLHVTHINNLKEQQLKQ